MKALLLTAALSSLAAAANAATYILSYTDVDDNTYSAILTADLDTDSDTLINISTTSFTINGVEYPADVTDSYTNVTYSSSADAVLTLSGSTVDYYVASTAYSTGFGMSTGTAASFYNTAFVSSALTASEGFVVANYSLTEVVSSVAATVPVPASLSLALTGLAGLVALRRRAA